jgi:NAD(P)-dependent dehydrogenase (short-subunit alcohol dehydrogenase family)
VLTGGSAGIGLSIVQALSDHAHLVVISRTSPPADLKGGTWIKGDLHEPETVADKIITDLSSRNEPLVGLIHCAASYGASQRHGFLETTASEWHEVFAVNVTSQFVLTHRLLPLLLAGHRSFIVSISSNTATEPAPGRIAYGCSKAASHALFSGLAAEYADSPLAVVQVLPDRQVVTRGLKRRRPEGFDFSSYIRPEVFQEPIREIVLTRGQGRNGQSLILH